MSSVDISAGSSVASAAPAAASSTVARSPQTVFCSALLDRSGYAQVGRTLLRALDRRGVPIRARPNWGAMRLLKPGENAPGGVVVEVPGPDGMRRLASDVGEAQSRAIIALRDRADVRPDVVVTHNVPGAVDGRDFFAEARGLNPGLFWFVGLTVFETDRCPASWLAPCARVDELWVPTRFNYATFAASGVDPAKMRVMPFGVAPLGPGDVDPSYRIETTKSFKFLSVFEMTKRKGWDVLLKAWVEAFSPDDDVALVVKTYGRNGAKPHEVFARALEALGRDPERIPEIVLIEDRLSDAAMQGLYPQCDAFVLPSRGEGWGMPYLEALRHGLPVIATRWSGQLEFLRDENSFLVELDGLSDVDADQVRDDPLYEGHRWAEPSVASLVEQLRRVRSDAEERRRRAARGAEEAATLWTADRAAARMQARLEEIEAKRRAFVATVADRIETPARVVWRGPVASPSGYGTEAREYLAALEARGVDVAVRPFVWDRSAAELDRAEVEKQHRLCLRAADPDAIVVHQLFAEHYKRGAERVSIVRTTFETDRLPTGWREALEPADEIWVPSRHNLVTFAASGVPRGRIRVVPGAIDMGFYAPEGPRTRVAPDGAFTFLSIFEWSQRKAPDMLIRAYTEAFAGRDDVLLALRASPPAGHTPAEVAYAVKAIVERSTPAGRKAPPIKLLDPIKDVDLPAAYRGADAFVLPTRGEGFGRPFLEAAACGLPVIATRWSGPLDFLDDATAYLVDAKLVDVPERAWKELFRFRGHRWAEPDFAHLKRRMLEVAGDRRAAASTGARAAASVRRTHAASVVAAQMAKRFEELRG